jgi:hypothetical protein
MSPAIDATVTLPAEYCRRLFGAGAAAEEAAVWAVCRRLRKPSRN